MATGRVYIVEFTCFRKSTCGGEFIRSYISCCAEAVGNSYPLPSLEKTVIEFFKNTGWIMRPLPEKSINFDEPCDFHIFQGPILYFSL